MKNINFTLLFLFITIFNSCSSKLTTKQLTSQLGVNANIDKNIYYWSSGQDLQGEGFEISVYSLKLKTGDIVNSNYPLVDLNKKDWNISTWEKTPVSLNDFDILLEYNVKNEKVRKYILDIENTLKQDGNFYCYYYHFAKNTNIIIGIDLYVIDSREKIFYNSEINI
jgi:hypothetical protein